MCAVLAAGLPPGESSQRVRTIAGPATGREIGASPPPKVTPDLPQETIGAPSTGAGGGGAGGSAGTVATSRAHVASTSARDPEQHSATTASTVRTGPAPAAAPQTSPNAVK